jgi:hypothetical protein
MAQGEYGAVMVAGALSERQAEAMRRLIYDDLRKAAEEMANQARASLDDDGHRPQVHGLYDRMTMMASILDVVGWGRPRTQDSLAARRLPDPPR